MNALQTLSSNTDSISSKELSELTGSRHDKVKQSIELLVEQGVVMSPIMKAIPFVDNLGREMTTEAYIFQGEQGKRDSIVVIARISPEVIGRLVDRWFELEKSKTHQTYIEAVEELLVSLKENVSLEET